MNKSNKIWILATCIVVTGTIIYIVNGISNETSDNSPHSYSSKNQLNESSSNNSSSHSNYSSTPTIDELNSQIKQIGKQLRNYDTSYNSNSYTISEYKGNQLKNGSSPFDACFGKGIYSGNATLTIKNGSSSDAIVCLYSISRGRTIRNEYIRKNSSFTMGNIVRGNYKIRVLYGNDWNPTLENFCGTKGNFESDVSFSEFDGTKYFEDTYDGYTVATLTLYAVVGGNASTSRISQSDFFSK